MAKKRRKRREAEAVTEEYYRLKSQAVDDLIHADESNSPEVSEAELAKYRSHRGLHLPSWVKALLVKAWFYGSACFFFLWGLGAYAADQLDLLVIVGIAMGMVTDLLTNNVLRYLADTPGGNDRWMMFPRRAYASFFFNIVYALWILFCVVWLYNFLNLAILSVTGADGTVPLGVEPILFGVFCTAFDVLFVTMKRTAQSIYRDAVQSAGGPRSRRGR